MLDRQLLDETETILTIGISLPGQIMNLGIS